MYEMIIHVDSADDMAIIVQACKGTAQLISSKLLEPRKGLRRRSNIEQTPIVRKSRIVGMTGAELLRQTFADGRNHRTRDLQLIFASNGFAAKSASPALSQLTKSGEVKQLSEGEYIRTTKLKEVNSGAERN